MMSELEYLDKDCEMTVLPQPKAPKKDGHVGSGHVVKMTRVFPTGNRCGSSLNRGEKTVQNALTSQQGMICGKLLVHRTRLADLFEQI